VAFYILCIAQRKFAYHGTGATEDISDWGRQESTQDGFAEENDNIMDHGVLRTQRTPSATEAFIAACKSNRTSVKRCDYFKVSLSLFIPAREIRFNSLFN
jgi:hypothetical protein